MAITNEEGVLRADPAMAEDKKEYETLVRNYVAAGQLLLAIEIARDGLRRFPESLVLQQQLALALAQTGAFDAAKLVLADLLKDAPRDEEARSLLGRVYKELWRRTSDPAAAAEALKTATKWYAEAFDLKWSSYPGINLAFTHLAAGDRDKAREIAAKVAKACKTELEGDPNTRDGWLLATLGEALTHLGDIEGAAKYYKAAAQAFAGRWRDLASMQKQAREIIRLLRPPQQGGVAEAQGFAAVREKMRKLVLNRRDPDQAWLDRSFEFPSIVIFAGHMIDAPGRSTPRFPAANETRVRDAIAAKLEEFKAGIGYSSAACGADIIFCECMLARKGRVNLVLPTTVESFKRQSVHFAGGEWEKRFHDVLANASSVLFANASELTPSHDAATPAAHRYAASIVTGLAAMESRALDLDIHALTVWNSVQGDGPGGTASAVRDWSAHGIVADVINPLTLAVSRTGPAVGQSGSQAVGQSETSNRQTARPPDGPTDQHRQTARPSDRPTDPIVRQEVRAVVYAEILNYRRITENQMDAYVHDVRGAIAQLIATLTEPPEICESRFGDQEYIFADVEDASTFALALRDLVTAGPIAALALTKESQLGIKLVLHAGPVFLFDDPVTRRPTAAGAHVFRAQRIRSITPAGEIYASQEFAALSALASVPTVRYEFLGRVPTTKLFEDAPLYRIDRAPKAR